VHRRGKGGGHILHRHPEERALARVSKDGSERRRLWPILRGSPLRGEHLRMTLKFLALFHRHQIEPEKRPFTNL
jgi:hypothetical protein